MKLTDRWLLDPSDYVSGDPGSRMWNTHAAVDKNNVLSFCMHPSEARKYPAKLILAKNEAGFGITLIADSPFKGIRTHAEYPSEFIQFKTIFVSDEYPGRASMYAEEQNGPIAELLIEPAKMVAWTFCKMVNRKLST